MSEIEAQDKADWNGVKRPNKEEWKDGAHEEEKEGGKASKKQGSKDESAASQARQQARNLKAPSAPPSPPPAKKIIFRYAKQDISLA